MMARRQGSRGRWRGARWAAVAACCLALTATAPSARALETCRAAASVAERDHALPPGLLFAIGRVESGRLATGAGQPEPWPWTVNANEQGLFFPSKAAALTWVREAQARGTDSIDVGCFQINLHYHPAAFATLEEALDPARNADYAARFLVALHAQLGDWGAATGAYHSETPALAAPYRRQVADALGVAPPPSPLPPPPDPTIAALRSAWGATLPANPARKPAAAPLPGQAAALTPAMRAHLPAAPDPAMRAHLPTRPVGADTRLAAADLRATIWERP